MKFDIYKSASGGLPHITVVQIFKLQQGLFCPKRFCIVMMEIDTFLICQNWLFFLRLMSWLPNGRSSKWIICLNIENRSQINVKFKTSIYSHFYKLFVCKLTFNGCIFSNAHTNEIDMCLIQRLKVFFGGREDRMSSLLSRVLCKMQP